MKPPAWLCEFHRQWHAVRGRRVKAGVRTFLRRWEELLDDAGLSSAADRNYAVKEAEDWEKKGHLILKRHRYRRYLIESVGLPVGQEEWLAGLFGQTPARALLEQSIGSVRKARNEGHPRWPQSWHTLCDDLDLAFAEGRNVPPFFWHQPLEVASMLSVLRGLTDREWAPDTPIREASMTLNPVSKFLERSAASLESALSLLFQQECSLESLGLCRGQGSVVVHGPLCLHFPDQTTQAFENLRGEFALSLSDLLRASAATTTASQVLSIENVKTTFRQAASCNGEGDTLLVASSYPNLATRRLLEILPDGLAHYHFGDTDPAGFSILRAMRKATTRHVHPFLMNWQDDENSKPLSERDNQLLASLLETPSMADCAVDLLEMKKAGRRGIFEQEAKGPPSLKCWPFWPDGTKKI